MEKIEKQLLPSIDGFVNWKLLNWLWFYLSKEVLNYSNAPFSDSYVNEIYNMFVKKN